MQADEEEVEPVELVVEGDGNIGIEWHKSVKEGYALDFLSFRKDNDGESLAKQANGIYC